MSFGKQAETTYYKGMKLIYIWVLFVRDAF